jgi:hypothetical protein
MGRIGAGDDFLASPLYTPFVNFAFDGNPGSVPINIPAFSTYPVATWGLRTKVMPVEPWSVSNQRPGWRARECARALPDPGSFHELLGPLHRAESPWLPRQGSCPNPMTVSALRTGSSPANPPYPWRSRGRSRAVAWRKSPPARSRAHSPWHVAPVSAVTGRTMPTRGATAPHRSRCGRSWQSHGRGNTPTHPPGRHGLHQQNQGKDQRDSSQGFGALSRQ